MIKKVVLIKGSPTHPAETVLTLNDMCQYVTGDGVMVVTEKQALNKEWFRFFSEPREVSITRYQVYNYVPFVGMSPVASYGYVNPELDSEDEGRTAFDKLSKERPSGFFLLRKMTDILTNEPEQVEAEAKIPDVSEVLKK